jgi:hypothetical protein
MVLKDYEKELNQQFFSQFNALDDYPILYFITVFARCFREKSSGAESNTN